MLDFGLTQMALKKYYDLECERNVDFFVHTKKKIQKYSDLECVWVLKKMWFFFSQFFPTLPQKPRHIFIDIKKGTLSAICSV